VDPTPAVPWPDLVRAGWAALGRDGLLVEGVPWAVRGTVLAAGAVSLFAGGRLQRHGVRIAVALAGALLAVAAVQLGPALPALPGGPRAQVVAGIALVGVAVALWIELLAARAALVLAGFVAGVLIGLAATPVFASEPGPAWTLLPGLAAAFSVPWVYETAPRVVSPLLATPAVGWAVGLGGAGPLGLVGLAALWGLGVTAQWFTGPDHVTIASRGEARATWRRR
jgi:hypothetical protein